MAKTKVVKPRNSAHASRSMVQAEKIAGKVKMNAVKQAKVRQKLNYKLEKMRIKGKPGNIEATGRAIATATTPTATAITAQRTSEQVTAQKKIAAEEAANKWYSLLGGNPDKESGSDGSTQGQSSTTTTSGGSILGG